MSFIATWIFAFIWLMAIRQSSFENTLKFMLSDDGVIFVPFWFGIIYATFLSFRLLSFVGGKLISNMRKYVGSAKTKCKWCKETIKTDALKCKHCGMMLTDEENAS